MSMHQPWLDEPRALTGAGRLREQPSVLARLRPTAWDDRSRARRRRRDARARDRVGTKLANMSRDWTALHDVLLGPDGAALDHLVIGPAGVFPLITVLGTGHLVVHQNGIRVHGRATDLVAQAQRTAEAVRARLVTPLGVDVPIRPAVIVVGAPPDIRRLPPDVAVVHLHGLRQWLRRHPPGALDDDDIRRLVTSACTPASRSSVGDGDGRLRAA